MFEDIVQSLLNTCLYDVWLFDPHQTTCQTNPRGLIKKPSHLRPHLSYEEGKGEYVDGYCGTRGGIWSQKNFLIGVRDAKFVW